MSLNLVVSLDINNCIGNNNDLLYDIPEDKKYFRNITTNKESQNIVVMGKNTWESIPNKYRPLKNRLNVIISKTMFNSSNNYDIEIFKNFNDFMNEYQDRNIYIIGGSQLYKEVIDNYKIDTLFITEINDNTISKKSLDNPIYFPNIDYNNYDLTHENKLITTNYKTQYYTDISKITCTFKVYQLNSNVINSNVINYNIKNYLQINNEEYQYLDIMKDLITNGDKRKTRNATTFSKFGIKMEFDLEDKIPILTTKRVACKTVIKELLWFIKGSTNNKILQDQNVHIWDGNSSREFLDKSGFKDREENELGPIYGFQWRHSGAEYKSCHDDYTDLGIDQLKECIDTLKNNPTSRRMLVCAWNPKDLNQMALPPCHILFQWYVSSDNRLSLQLYQRSGDFFLGVPFNIMSYSVLIYMVAHITGLKPGKFIHIIGDAHAYDCHLYAINEQLKRIPSEFPTLKFNRKVESIDDFTLDDFEIECYNCHNSIKAEMVA